ncbi:YidC/Oxa1 family membrane protein insertase [Patescibacteria group bacterium]|nr:YidC/Oxa1 family membrane protein insertase [Patescibacteria group bacterium]
MFTTILYQPLINALVFFYQLTDNLGWAILLMTVLLRLALLPITWASLRSSQKVRKLSPELNALKKKFKKDKQGLAKAQMELYKKEGIKPAAGCLPQLVQLVVLIAFYRAFNQFLTADQEALIELNSMLIPSLRFAADGVLNTRFWYLTLTEPEVIKIAGLILPGPFLIAAALVQFLSSKRMLPQVKQSEELAEKTISSTDDAMVGMQKQMVYLFPLMTLFIGLRFPSGLVLYWLAFSLVNLLQYFLMDRIGNKDQKKK